MAGRLKQLQQASAALAAVVELEDTERLLLKELRQLCAADLVVMFEPMTPQHWRSTSCMPEGTLPVSLPPLDMIWGDEETGTDQRSPVEPVLQKRQPLHCDDPIRSGKYNFSHLRFVEVELKSQVVSCLLLPLAGRTGRAEQIVELIRLGTDSTSGFSADEQAMASILTQQAASGLIRIRCRQEISELFESLIQLIGSAIDEKSPYAGDHCRRVPVLTMMLARAVSASLSDKFEAIEFSDAELYELEVAAWLHDIGKLITPIHISDKATKLERTFDRFDLVRTRFEILRRDLEISRLRAGSVAEDVEIPGSLLNPQQMLDDLRFLADCNRGRNSLAADDSRRVREIAANYCWIDRQGEEMPVLTSDEANNLLVVRGTLTEEELEMINNHVVSTINMLDMLPFPQELARVPEIAGAHHEYYNGRGFPSGLSGEQMLPQTRILAFADLFESVSAGSRPYKKRNSLSQSLTILRQMVDDGQTDPGLYRLFVEEKIYETYAIEFLGRDQIDPVDTSILLAGLKDNG